MQLKSALALSLRAPPILAIRSVSYTGKTLYDMHEFYCTAVHVLVVPGGESLLAFRLPARVYRWGGRVGVSTLDIHVLSNLRGSPGEKYRTINEHRLLHTGPAGVG